MCKPLYNCVIVDDNEDFVEQLTEYLQHFEKVRLVKAFTDSSQAISEMENYPDIDFLFLDIEMPKVDGIITAKKLRERVSNIVFISAHSRFALDAFNVSASGFLPKPLSFEKFQDFFNLQLSKLTSKEVEQHDFLMAKESAGEEGLVKVFLNQVLLVEAHQDYLFLTTKDNVYTSSFPKESLIEILVRDHSLIKVSEELLVCPNFVSSVDGDMAVLENGRLISLTEPVKLELRELLIF